MEKRISRSDRRPADADGALRRDGAPAEFRCREYDAGTQEPHNDSRHRLVLLLEGECTLRCDGSGERVFHAGEMTLLPAGRGAVCRMSGGTRTLELSFTALPLCCGRPQVPQDMPEAPESECGLRPLEIRRPVADFAATVLRYREEGFWNATIEELKSRELWILLRWCYTAEELSALLRPLLGGRGEAPPRDCRTYDTIPIR